jgi:hypothetical protein
MKEKLNPGDRIMLYHMEDEFLSPGTKGTVQSITRDPFEDDGLIISVMWDNGRQLSLLSKLDVWKKLESSSLNESTSNNPQVAYIQDNEYILRNFDISFIRQFLLDLRDSGITNMFGASPLLYSGSDYITKKFGSPYDIEFTSDEQLKAYERVVENADEVKQKILNGVMKVMEKRGEDFDIDKVKREIQNASRKLLAMYMVFF